MKYLKIFMGGILLLSGSVAEDLSDTYSSGTVVFTPDETYESSSQFFQKQNYHIKDYTHIQIASDGRAFILNRMTHEVLVFGSDGSFERSWKVEIPVSNSVYHNVHDMGILDEKYLVVSGYNILLVYSLTGELHRRIEKDYPIREIVCLKNDKVAVEGYIMDQRGESPKKRMYIGIIDIQNASDAQVTYFEEDLHKEMIIYKREGGTIGMYSRSRRSPDVHLARTADGNLIVGYSANPNLSIYSAAGEYITDIQLKYPPPLTSDDELAELREGYIKSARKHIENETLRDSMIAEIQSDDFFFKRTPNYYDVMTDSEGNILVFKHKKSEKNHVVTVYQVYAGNGEFISETVLLFEPFERPDLRSITFGPDYLYGLFENKEDGRIGLYRGTFQKK